jgi:aspartate/methionine/tyrosine aminotransferase
MRIEPFGVEQWMNEWETRCDYNLAETCVSSLTVAELLELAGLGAGFLETLLPLRLTYGSIEGSERLRDAIATLYTTRTAEDVLVTHGAIGANHLVHLAVVEPGDRVVSIVPGYQQHTSIPASIGADVRRLRLRPEDGWLPDLDELRGLVDGSAKLIVLTNPSNPTGALVDEAGLQAIAEIAAEAGAYVLCDEVYRGTDQDGDGMTASMADLYERGISTSSVTKAFSLAGLRLGWIAGPPDVIKSAMIQRDYSTISVGMIDDILATVAIEHRDALFARTRDIVRGNLNLLDSWVTEQPDVTYVRPRSGTTALLACDTELSSRELCIRLLEGAGVMYTPGSVFGAEGHVRIGYANDAEVLTEGLARTSEVLAQL